VELEKLKSPKEGERITVNRDYSLNVPDSPIIPFIEGDGVGKDIWPAACRVLEAGVRGATGKKENLLVRDLRRGKGLPEIRGVVTQRYPRGYSSIHCGHQGPSYYSGGRRNPEPQCYSKARTKPLCLRATSKVFLRGT